MKPVTSRRLVPWLATIALVTAVGSVIADTPTRGPGDRDNGCDYHQGAGHYGPGMMGGGYGPGMMGDGYGPGMMGGGYGPGMMGGGYDPGMMGGYGVDLTPEQRKEANALMDQTRKEHWSMMGAMMDEQSRLRDLYAAENPDRKAIAESYKRLGDIRQSMYESMINTRMKLDDMLTPEQRAKMHQYRR